MPETCSHCGDDAHTYKCAQALSVELAESVLDHQEDIRNMAAMRVEVAELRDQVHILSVELHQLGF